MQNDYGILNLKTSIKVKKSPLDGAKDAENFDLFLQMCQEQVMEQVDKNGLGGKLPVSPIA